MSDRFTISQVVAHNAKFSPQAKAPADACERETGRDGLHAQIIRHCESQWPRWKFIHHRTDIPSGIEEGAPDFTIFLPGGKTCLIECKTRTGKLSEKQRNWAHEAAKLGHEVKVVFNMPQFENTIAGVMTHE